MTERQHRRTPQGAISRRRALASIFAACAALPFSPTAMAQAWPTKTLRIIVPFAPGGPADGSARVLAEAMAPALGQLIIVENKTGAGGAIGVTAAAQSNDGHTLLMGSTSMVVTPHLIPNVQYNVTRDFEPIGMVSAQPLVLVVPASSPLRSVKDVIAAAKASPGKLTAGNSGNGTLAHLTAELFSKQTDVSLTSVPYRGESALMPDLLSGNVDMGFINLPVTIPQVRAGKLRALAVTAAQPLTELPGVQTFKALGISEMEVEGWAALLATRGVPPEGRARLETALSKALATDEVRKRFAEFGVTPVVKDHANTAAYLKSEGERWGQVVRSRGIKAE